jgi:hypothetical protein
MNIKAMMIMTLVPSILNGMDNPSAASQMVSICSTQPAATSDPAKLLERLKAAKEGFDKIHSVKDKMQKQKNSKAKVNTLLQNQEQLVDGTLLLWDGVEALIEEGEIIAPKVEAFLEKIEKWMEEKQKAAAAQPVSASKPSCLSNCLGKLLCNSPVPKK